MTENVQARSRGRLAIGRTVLRWIVRAMLAILLFWALSIAVYRVLPPVSTLMLGRWLTLQPVERIYMPLSDISPHLARAAIAAEDSRFCMHAGIDWFALQSVIEDALGDGASRGASTITMQTVKNILLWPGRSYLRKGLELPLALVLDTVWPKRRVMEAYLNIAEWGEGVFGAEAAARRHFGKSAKDLTRREAALLVAALPNPIARNPGRPTRYLSTYASRIMARMGNENVSCLGA